MAEKQAESCLDKPLRMPQDRRTRTRTLPIVGNGCVFDAGPKDWGFSGKSRAGVNRVIDHGSFRHSENGNGWPMGRMAGLYGHRGNFNHFTTGKKFPRNDKIMNE